ncbi:MAG: glycerophosphodiester phosphodiesterase family protein [Pseudomonadota bacterium]
MSSEPTLRTAIAARSRRNWFVVIGISFFIVAFRVLSLAPPLDGAFSTIERPSVPWVVAEAGGSRLRPANTLSAFRYAAEAGADMLHADLRLTQDGIVVAFGAQLLETQTDGRGAVEEATFAMLAGLDAAYRWRAGDAESFRYRGLGVRIPTLDRLLLRLEGLPWLLWLRGEGTALGEEVCSVVRRQRAESRVLVAADDARILQAFRRACPGVPTLGHRWERLWFQLYAWIRAARWVESPAVAYHFDVPVAGFDWREPVLYYQASRTGRTIFLRPKSPSTGTDAFATKAFGVLTTDPVAAVALRRQHLGVQSTDNVGATNNDERLEAAPGD